MASSSAEVRLGEYFAGMDKAKGGQPFQAKNSTPDTAVQSKAAALDHLGFSVKQAQRMETLAAVRQAGKDAIIEGQKNRRKKEDGVTLSIVDKITAPINTRDTVAAVRQAGRVLGVGQKTIDRDLESNDSKTKNKSIQYKEIENNFESNDPNSPLTAGTRARVGDTMANPPPGRT